MQGIWWKPGFCFLWIKPEQIRDRQGKENFQKRPWKAVTQFLSDSSAIFVSQLVSSTLRPFCRFCVMYASLKVPRPIRETLTPTRTGFFCLFLSGFFFFFGGHWLILQPVRNQDIFWMNNNTIWKLAIYYLLFIFSLQWRIKESTTAILAWGRRDKQSINMSLRTGVSLWRRSPSSQWILGKERTPWKAVTQLSRAIFAMQLYYSFQVFAVNCGSKNGFFFCFHCTLLYQTTYIKVTYCYLLLLFFSRWYDQFK